MHEILSDHCIDSMTETKDFHDNISKVFCVHLEGQSIQCFLQINLL